jgi:hypothetical protein
MLAKALEVQYEQQKDRDRIEATKKYNEWRKLHPGKGATDYIAEIMGT